MSFDPRVTPDMVIKFDIGLGCRKKNGCCEHACKIYLSNGREFRLFLDASSIDILIKAVSKANIGTHHHPAHYSCPHSSKESAESILTRVFSEKIIL